MSPDAPAELPAEVARATGHTLAMRDAAPTVPRADLRLCQRLTVRQVPSAQCSN